MSRPKALANKEPAGSPAISFASFTVQAITDNAFLATLPDYYKLKEVEESQPWHDHQTVFDHSIKSAKALDKIIQFDFLDGSYKDRLTNYLNRSAYAHTRLSLLRLAVLLHDIGKLVSLQQDTQGNTSSPSHGIIGAWVAKPLLNEFDLAASEKGFVLNLVADHLVPTDLIELSFSNGMAPPEILAFLQANRPESTVELLLLSYADWLGCSIREPVREEREKKIKIAHECLAILAAGLE